jgi:hypothetical protein
VLACHKLLAVGKHVNKGIEIEITVAAIVTAVVVSHVFILFIFFPSLACKT